MLDAITVLGQNIDRIEYGMNGVFSAMMIADKDAKCSEIQKRTALSQGVLVADQRV